MVQLASMIACQAVSEYRVMLGAALTVGVTPVEVKEIVYQAVPYVGMAKVFDFLHATNDVLTARGVELPLDGQSTTTPETRAEKGLAVQKQIVGADAVDAMYAAAPDDELHIQHYLSANCFGDHYTRTGIDLPTRELLTFAMLISLGGCEPQAKGHVAANLNVGNGRDVLLAVITQLLPFIGYPRSLNALRVLNEVTSRNDRGSIPHPEQRRGDPGRRVRRLPDAAGRDHRRRRDRAGHRLPPHRHRRGVRQRARGRRGDPPLRPRPLRGLRRDEDLDQRLRLRRDAARLRQERGQARRSTRSTC